MGVRGQGGPRAESGPKHPSRSTWIDSDSWKLPCESIDSDRLGQGLGWFAAVDSGLSESAWRGGGRNPPQRPPAGCSGPGGLRRVGKGELHVFLQAMHLLADDRLHRDR